MQKWYDDGYFTPNLLMKRTTIDAEWTSVGELLQRAGNPRIFLTPLIAAPPPPGFPRRDPLLDGPAPDGTFGSPFQPVPARALRVSAVDAFMHNGSLVPDSPSSSFSAGRFSNGSPDPTTFGGTIDDDKEPATPTLSLCEIQEMEAKKAEARSVAEHERERAARAASGTSAAPEKAQVIAWGLPTSQVARAAALAT